VKNREIQYFCAQKYVFTGNLSKPFTVLGITIFEIHQMRTKLHRTSNFERNLADQKQYEITGLARIQTRFVVFPIEQRFFSGRYRRSDKTTETSCECHFRKHQIWYKSVQKEHFGGTFEQV
tara:strand:+ start:44 stop:406 length:363 start_codon:yes stop_codon:yes gene_type:complete